MKIVLGSMSELKLSAVKQAFEFLKEKNIYKETVQIEQTEVESGVAHTPYNDETHRGADNRVHAIWNKENDLSIALESGLIERDGIMFEECWCVVLDKEKKEYVGISSAMQLPERVNTELKAGKPHNIIMNEMGEELNIFKKDNIGIYSKGALSRSFCMFEACRNALISYFIKH